MNADRGSAQRFTVAAEDEAADRRLEEPSAPAPVSDPVDEASKGSFPASDPPSWWAGPDPPRPKT